MPGNVGLCNVTKYPSVKTPALVARELNVNEAPLDEVTDQTDPEDGMIWVYCADGAPVIALSDDGVECLLDLIAIQRENQNRKTCGLNADLL